MKPMRALFAVVLVALAGLLASRVLVTPGAGEPDGARDPVHRLQAAPLAGAAFADVAVASQRAGDPARALALHDIAARRAPRDLRVRAWLADHHLQASHPAEALEQLDVVLRLSRDAREGLLPLMAQWADDPAFADALVAKLREDPNWRGAMITALRADVERPGAGAVIAGLDRAGDLDDLSMARWLDALMKAGKWGVAYSYWASGLGLPPGEPLPMLYNAGFEQPATQRGFDWRTERRAGTYTEFEAAEGASGNAAHLVFLGRPVEAANLEQALMLSPGRFRVSARVRAIGLRSDQGLRWTVTCHGSSKPLALGDALDGTFGWRETALDFEVPAEGCPGQWLRLQNPAPRGSARVVSGELWVDGMALRPMGEAAPGAF